MKEYGFLGSHQSEEVLSKAEVISAERIKTFQIAFVVPIELGCHDSFLNGEVVVDRAEEETLISYHVEDMMIEGSSTDS